LGVVSSRHPPSVGGGERGAEHDGVAPQACHPPVCSDGTMHQSPGVIGEVGGRKKRGGRDEKWRKRRGGRTEGDVGWGGVVAGRIVREGGGKEEEKGRGVREEGKKGGQVGGRGVREKRTLFVT